MLLCDFHMTTNRKFFPWYYYVNAFLFAFGFWWQWKIMKMSNWYDSTKKIIRCMKNKEEESVEIISLNMQRRVTVETDKYKIFAHLNLLLFWQLLIHDISKSKPITMFDSDACLSRFCDDINEICFCKMLEKLIHIFE